MCVCVCVCIGLYNSLMVSLKLFANTDKDGYLCPHYREARDLEEIRDASNPP